MNYYDLTEVGKRIRAMRKVAGLTQEKLAEKIGVERSMIAHIETGRRACSIDVMIQLVEIFDTTLDYLVLGVTSDTKELKRQLVPVVEQLQALCKSM